MVKIHCNLGKTHRMIDKFVPANRSEQSRFGRTDEVVIAMISFSLVSLLCFVALVYLWAH
jgi:hypothetical protein